VDLDEPLVLAAEELRPSLVATHERPRTQADATALYQRHEAVAGLRWWSTFESQWANVTLFDRALGALEVEDVRVIALEDDVVYHTYSCYDRGTDVLNCTWQLLDRAPNGRGDDLADWPRRHDEYEGAAAGTTA